MKKDTITMSMPKEPKPMARFTLGKKQKTPKLVSGEKVKVIVYGRLSGLTDDEYGKSFSITIDDIDVDSGLAGDIRSVKKGKKVTDDEDEPAGEEAGEEEE